MSRYLVTGCAGFVGSHLTDSLLGAGHYVVGIDCFTGYYARELKERNLAAARESSAFEFHERDLADGCLNTLFDGVDGVFHLAAQAGVRGSWGAGFDGYVQQNLLTTQRVFEASASAGIRVAFASSSSIYGDALAQPTPEFAPPCPVSPYGLTKLACEQLATLYAAQLGLDAVVLRYFTVYGPRQRPDMAFSLIAAALRGEGSFTIFGDGAQSRDATYVGDAVDATIAAFHRAPRAATFNVGGGTEATLLEVIAIAEEIAGRPVPVEHGPVASGDVRRTSADTQRIRAETGWEPAVELREGLSAQLEAQLADSAKRESLSIQTRRAPAQPLVSIVVPTFNGARYLREALDSIAGQTYPRTEILVMDDASSDETEEIVASYGARIAYHRQSQTRGIYANANDGIAIARGELIAIYHADDVYHPEIVEREVEYLRRNPKVGAVFCKDTFVDEDGRAFGRLELPREVSGSEPLDYETVVATLLKYKNRFLRCPSSMVRASVYRSEGTYRPDRFKNTSDLEMWLRIARRHPIGVIDEHLFNYRRGHGSSSERYHAHRVEPERYFEILDLELGDGARALVGEETLAAYEAHRAEDQLKVTVSNYVLGRRHDSREALQAVSTRQLLASDQVQRARLLALAAIMHGLVRLPRIPPAAQMLDRRLFDRRPRAQVTAGAAPG